MTRLAPAPGYASLADILDEALTTRGGTAHLAGHKVTPVKRVSSGAFLGTRRLDKLRPSTAHEVAQAHERGKASQ